MTEIPLIRKSSRIFVTEFSILLDKASKGKYYYDRNTTMTEVLLFLLSLGALILGALVLGALILGALIYHRPGDKNHL